MEQKHLLGWSTLGLGLSMGVGLGLGLATRGLVKPTCLSPRPSEILETELYAQVIDGKDSSVTFDQFPYYLKISWLVRSEQTRVLLTNAAYVHLMQREYSKFTRNLSPASPAILLTGPAGSEAYQQMLAKALAHYFEAKLLLLDVSDFLSKVQCKCGELKLGLEPASGMFTKVVADKINDFYVSLSDLAIQIPEDVRRSFSSGSVTPYPEKTKANLKTSGSKKALDGKSSPKIQEAEAGGGKGIASFRNGLYQGSSPRRTSPRGFDDKSLIDALFRVLASVSQNSPIVLYLRDVQKLLFRGQKTYSLFVRKMKFSGPVLILGSRISHGTDIEESDIVVEKLEKIFPYTISIKAPEDIARLVSWRSQLEEDMKAIEAQDNRNHISEVLAANDVECDDLASICFNDTLLLSNYIEEIAVSAISHHLMNTEEPNYRAGSLLISSKSLAYGLSLFQAGQLETKDSKLQAEVKSEPTKEPQETSAKSMVKAEVPIVDAKSESSKPDSGLEVTKKAETDGSKGIPAAAGAKVAEVAPDNEFEKRIRPEVIPAGEIGVSFEDIGALENVKESLQELVMLPLQRPELFKKGRLIKPCKGILLFGPPGTGKTMLAKAVATEANASFINVSMSSITSKWFGEDEKNVRALFTLAEKVAPTIIFIDEVDSMLGQRSRAGEHEAMRKIKNEFMAHWDGLLSKGGERVLVLAATNRPFDLDEAIIRRFERRVMVGLPDAQNREKILRRILSKELLSENFDFSELAVMTEGYSGSDLKNLCTTAAYWPVRDLLKKEREAAGKKKVQVDEENSESSADASSEISKDDGDKEPQNRIDPPPANNVNCSVLTLRPLTMEDMRQAKGQISASFTTEGAGMAELQEWNDLFGEGGSRKKQQLTYFI